MTALNADVINRTTLDFNLQRSQIPLPGISSAKKQQQQQQRHLSLGCYSHLGLPRLSIITTSGGSLLLFICPDMEVPQDLCWSFDVFFHHSVVRHIWHV